MFYVFHTIFILSEKNWSILQYFIFSVYSFDCIIFKYLFLAGNGEIIVWDVPSGEIVWRIGVGKVLFSDLVWITKDVLLASLTTGVVLKCDTTL